MLNQLLQAIKDSKVVGLFTRLVCEGSRKPKVAKKRKGGTVLAGKVCLCETDHRAAAGWEFQISLKQDTIVAIRQRGVKRDNCKKETS